MSEDRKQYTYSALQGSESIRMITIHATAQNAPIQGRIEEMSLNNLPCFSALSYVWGDSTPTHDLLIDGRILKIRKNVFDFLLRRLRKKSCEFKIWIDAICINQEDYDERANQVLLMPRIYQSACDVLCHLGEPSETQNSQFLGLWEAISRMAYEQGDRLKEGSIDWRNLGQYGLPEIGDDRWRALVQFMESPWFSRIWIFQESLVARAGTILYGDVSIDQQEFFYILSFMQRHNFANHIDRRRLASPSPITTSILRCMAVCYHQGPFASPFTFQTWFRSPLIGLLRTTTTAKATDPHDKMFALLGVSNEADDSALRPNYNEPINDTYIRFAVHMVRKGYGHLVLDSSSTFISNNSAVPSWVPCWADLHGGSSFLRHDHHMAISTFFTASGPSNVAFQVDKVNCEVLSTNGIIVDEILFIGSSEFLLKSAEDAEKCGFGEERVLACLTEILQMMSLIPGVDADPEVTLHNLCRLAVCESEPLTGRKAPEEYTTGLKRMLLLESQAISRARAQGGLATIHILNHLPALIKPMLEHLLLFDKPIYDKHAVRFNDAAWINMSRLIRFITKRGYLGQVPPMAKIGDKVVLLQGCAIPFLLRPTEDGRYKKVTTCYVDGIMYGECWDTDNICKVEII